MQSEIKLFACCKCQLSESPIWSDQDKMLYWRGLDGEVFRKTIGSAPNDYERFDLNIGGIGSIVLTNCNNFLLFGDNGRVWKWKPYSTPSLYKDFGGSLFNDVLCDSKNRIFCGMLADNYFVPDKKGKNGYFYLLNQKGEFVLIDDKISATPNGIRINAQNDTLYFALTDDNCVYAYDYDLDSGKLSNKRVFAEDCFPDGIAIDNDGNLWVTDCRPNDSKLICFSKDGKRLNEWRLPVRRVLSVAFGGEDRKTLFITTAHEGLPKGEFDGGVFYMQTQTCGAKEYKYTLL